MITIDAKNKTLGRLASLISTYLIGKHKPDFVPYKNTGEPVQVINVDSFAVTGTKWESKIYYKHTGYMGHLRQKKMKSLAKTDILARAVRNMLPKNQLRKERMKMLNLFGPT